MSKRMGERKGGRALWVQPIQTRDHWMASALCFELAGEDLVPALAWPAVALWLVAVCPLPCAAPAPFTRRHLCCAL